MAHQGQALIGSSIYQFLCFLQRPRCSLRLVHLDLHRLWFQDISSDFDQVAVQFTLVPFSEDFSHVFCRKTKQVLHEVIAFCDQLHIPVLDPVVDHFHVVTSSIRTDVCHTWFSIFRCFLQRFLQERQLPSHMLFFVHQA